MTLAGTGTLFRKEVLRFRKVAFQTVAADLEMRAVEVRRDGAFDRFGGDHGVYPGGGTAQSRSFQPRRRSVSVSAVSAA